LLQLQVLWKFPTKEKVEASPSLSNDQKLVYVGSRDGFIYAIDALNGLPIWKTQLGAGVQVRTSFNIKIVSELTAGFFCACSAQ
jgi:outer membrane protein assembly factor BamB